MIPITVKWGKETISIELIPANGVKGLKADLESKTGVPADRMKLMPKSKGLWKGLLKEEFDLTSIDYAKIKPPIQMLLMGSAAKLTGPKAKTVFIEDLPPEEVAKVTPEPPGLANLGNTCYLNSVVQCLRAIPTLKTGLKNVSNSPPNTNTSQLTTTPNNNNNRLVLTSLSDLYSSLDRTVDPVTPSRFVMATKMALPQLAQTGPNGAPMQQDAEEFYSCLLNIAAAETSGTQTIQAAFGGTTPVNEAELNGARNLVDALFGIKMEETMTCDELQALTESGAVAAPSGDAMEVDAGVTEQAIVNHDLHRKLVCNIQGGSDASAQTNVTHVMEGIALSLNGKVEKRSEVLGRDAIWTRKQRIARLPSVLTIQFGRFFWKETPDNDDHMGVKCKVMKPVAFQGTLDIYEFCSEKVQKVLKKARDKALEEEDDRVKKRLKGETEAAKSMEVDGEEKGSEEDDEELKAALAMSLDPEAEKDIAVGPGLPADFQGKYELFAVVTHKGRDADGGHYMGWVKSDVQDEGKASKIADTDEDNDDWFVFDDDEVSPCKTEDVLKLKGGGDWHMSYLNFYRAKK